MARTHRTMKARKQRQLAKAWLYAFNNDSSEINKLNNERRELGPTSIRYGNKRKAMAETKVIDRRRSRRLLNSKVESE